MARKHTIFIGALFHIAIAMFESDSSTPWIALPASSLEPLPCTSQLPQAAARAWQHLGRLSIPKIGMDISTGTLSPLLIPSMGRSCCFSLFLRSLLKPEMSECACVLPPLQGRALQGSRQSLLPGLQHCNCSAQKLSQKAQLFWPENT